ncbi:MAG: hypothetical protein LBK63_09115 [Treponema sp.]|nr:hypothetical protein [Treponema sp.]
MEDLIFDYKSLGDNLAVPMEIIEEFEKEARHEFPFDNMLMEIHVLRAIKNYAKTNTPVMAHED